MTAEAYDTAPAKVAAYLVGVIAMTRAKSGVLVALACRAGAAVATDDSAILEIAGTFGSHAGVTAQILNDLAGIAPDAPKGRSDLRRRKKTLPVAYALRCARGETIAPLLAWYSGGDTQGSAGGPDPDESTIARMLRDLGGWQYAGIVADAHRKAALAAVRDLLRVTGRPAVGRLRRLVPVVRWHIGGEVGRC